MSDNEVENTSSDQSNLINQQENDNNDTRTDINASLSPSRKRRNSLPQNTDNDDSYFPPPKKFEVIPVERTHDWNLPTDLREYVVDRIMSSTIASPTTS